VQITPTSAGSLDLESLANRLRSAGPVKTSPFLVRFDAEGCALTIFPDGRAIIAGTKDVATARAIYARYIGA
jgi:TATA-box binding protein (TBP) (component of TFIID and TFIIIB)